VNFGVTFTMLAPTAVKGKDANPVFQELGRKSGEPTWNFNKYLVSADGKSVQHFDSRVTPDSVEMAKAIDRIVQ
jgi:glutathione peroxidase